MKFFFNKQNWDILP